MASRSLAVGGGLGNYLGGVLFDLGEQGGFRLVPWVVFAVVGLISVAGLFLNREVFSRVRGDDEPMSPVEMLLEPGVLVAVAAPANT